MSNAKPVYKAFAARPQDWVDVERVIQRQGALQLDWPSTFLFAAPNRLRIKHKHTPRRWRLVGTDRR